MTTRLRPRGLFRQNEIGVRRERLQAAAGEVSAFVRQTFLLYYDTLAPAVPRRAGSGDDVVLFLHGIMATAGVLRPLRGALERHPRVHTGALTYLTGRGVQAIAAQLAELAAAVPARAHLHLVGHSLGGVVARWYALHSGDRRVVQTISLASPFAGVPGVARIGLPFARDLDRESPLLQRITAHPDAASIPHLSIIAAEDRFVADPEEHALPGGEVLVLEARGHNALLYDDEVTRAVEERILHHRAARG